VVAGGGPAGMMAGLLLGDATHTMSPVGGAGLTSPSKMLCRQGFLPTGDFSAGTPQRIQRRRLCACMFYTRVLSSRSTLKTPLFLPCGDALCARQQILCCSAKGINVCQEMAPDREQCIRLRAMYYFTRISAAKS